MVSSKVNIGFLECQSNFLLLFLESNVSLHKTDQAGDPSLKRKASNEDGDEEQMPKRPKLPGVY